MKKIVFIFLFDFIVLVSAGITICLLNVYASSKENEMGVMYEEELPQEVLPLRDKQNKLIGINCTITLLEDFSKDKVKINPDVFGGIREYSDITFGDSFDINIEIKNKSKFKYNYVNDSLVIEAGKPREITKYKDTGGVGFDKKKIYDVFSPYRVFNSALRDLFQNKDISNLEDSDIDEVLKGIGYKGIVELDKYYLDFYNKKYELRVKKLEELPYSVLKEMFDGKSWNYKESNKRIIEVGYYYFFNKVVSISFLGEMVDDYNSENFSIGSYINKKKSDKLFRESIVEDGNNLKIEGINLKVSKFYMTDSFKDYDYLGYMEFTLNRKKD